MNDLWNFRMYMIISDCGDKVLFLSKKYSLGIYSSSKDVLYSLVCEYKSASMSGQMKDG